MIVNVEILPLVVIMQLTFSGSYNDRYTCHINLT